jgi:hypothetical protein
LTLYETVPSLLELLEETDAEDAAGVRGECLGPDPSVPRVHLRAVKHHLAELQRQLLRQHLR